MNTMLLLAATFGERMTTNVLDEPGVLLSPVALAGYAGAVGVWAGFSQLKGFISAIHALIAAIREAWPHIQPLIVLLIEALQKFKPPEDGTPAPSPLVVKTPEAATPDPLANALQQYNAATAAGDKELAAIWQKRYHDLKTKAEA